MPYLPVPRVEREADTYKLNYNCPKTIGRVKAYFGNFGMMIRALSYIYAHGNDGLREATETAVLNARYISQNLAETYDKPYASDCMHEAIFSHKNQTSTGVHTLDIAKRLIDYGFHPPTIYFPLIVAGALMIEPTESEPKEELDAFCDAMLAIAREAEENPELVKNAPHTTPVRRLDEARAARQPVLRWKP